MAIRRGFSTTRRVMEMATRPMVILRLSSTQGCNRYLPSFSTTIMSMPNGPIYIGRKNSHIYSTSANLIFSSRVAGT